jgi:hypothetical protein
LSVAATGTVKTGYGGSIPIVSSNGQTAGTGVVWALTRHKNASANSSTNLDAYDASSLTHLGPSHSAGTWSQQSDNDFITPLVAHGKVYAGGYQTVSIFGLTP